MALEIPFSFWKKVLMILKGRLSKEPNLKHSNKILILLKLLNKSQHQMIKRFWTSTPIQTYCNQLSFSKKDLSPTLTKGLSTISSARWVSRTKPFNHQTDLSNWVHQSSILPKDHQFQRVHTWYPTMKSSPLQRWSQTDLTLLQCYNPRKQS